MCATSTLYPGRQPLFPQFLSDTCQTYRTAFSDLSTNWCATSRRFLATRFGNPFRQPISSTMRCTGFFPTSGILSKIPVRTGAAITSPAVPSRGQHRVVTRQSLGAMSPGVVVLGKRLTRPGGEQVLLPWRLRWPLDSCIPFQRQRRTPRSPGGIPADARVPARQCRRQSGQTGRCGKQPQCLRGGSAPSYSPGPTPCFFLIWCPSLEPTTQNGRCRQRTPLYMGVNSG